MTRSRTLLTLLCLFSLLLAACGSTAPTTSPEDTPSEISVEPTDRPTSVVLPPTWTPTITRTITLTPTITMTRTETPIVTPQPTKETTPFPTTEGGEFVSLASAVILASDLPPGYQPLPIENYLLSAMMPGNQEFEIVRITSYASQIHEAAVMGMTFVFGSEEELSIFDEGLQSVPEELKEFEMESLFPEDIGMSIRIEFMPTFPAIGNNSVAFRMILSIEDLSIDYEVVMFRRGPVGAAVFVFGLSEDAQIPDLADLATLLDQRIVMAFEESQ
jgi:hypothetical protein